MFLIKAVGPGQKSTGSERGAVLVVSSLQQIIFSELLVSGVIVDNGDGALIADVVVVAGDVILGIGGIHVNFADMMFLDLFPVDNQIASLLGVTCDIAESYGQFDAQVDLHGGGEDGVVAEDFFFLVRVLWMSSDPDSSVDILRDFRAGHSHGTITKIDLGDMRADGLDAELVAVKFIFQAKEERGVNLFLGRLPIGKSQFT
ncbi:MAG: hypothetical protein FD151_2335 [bacterium]|nr:MAG: hypothetical protein FD151_2335 [bacterium]